MFLMQLLILFVHLVLPGYLIYSLWRFQPDNQYHWILRVSLYAILFAFLYMIGIWVWISYYLRYVIIGLFIIVAILSFRNVRSKPLFSDEGNRPWFKPKGTWLEIVIGIGLLTWTLSGFFYFEEAVELSFPLHEGRYYMYQAGNSPTLNYHNAASESQAFAVDLVAMNT